MYITVQESVLNILISCQAIARRTGTSPVASNSASTAIKSLTVKIKAVLKDLLSTISHRCL